MFTKKFITGDVIFNRSRNDQMLVINTNYSGYNTVRIDPRFRKYFDNDIVNLLMNEIGIPDITCPMFYSSQTVDIWFEKVASVERSYLYIVINLIGDFLRGNISYDDYRSEWSYNTEKPKVTKTTTSTFSTTSTTTVVENVDSSNDKDAVLDKIPENSVMKEEPKMDQTAQPSNRKYTLIAANNAGIRREYSEDEVFTIANAATLDVVKNIYPEIPKYLVQQMYAEARTILGVSKKVDRRDKWANYFREGCTKEDVLKLIPAVKEDPRRLKSLDSSWRYWQKRNEISSSAKYNFATFENSVKDAESKDRLQLAEAAESDNDEELSAVLKRTIPSSFARLLRRDIKIYLSKDIFYACFSKVAFEENFSRLLKDTDIEVYKTLIENIKPLWDKLPESVSEKYKLLTPKMRKTPEESQILSILSTVFINRFDNIDKTVKDMLDNPGERADKINALQFIYLISKEKATRMLISYEQSPYAAANKV